MFPCNIHVMAKKHTHTHAYTTHTKIHVQRNRMQCVEPKLAVCVCVYRTCVVDISKSQHEQNNDIIDSKWISYLNSSYNATLHASETFYLNFVLQIFETVILRQFSIFALCQCLADSN